MVQLALRVFVYKLIPLEIDEIDSYLNWMKGINISTHLVYSKQLINRFSSYLDALRKAWKCMSVKPMNVSIYISRWDFFKFLLNKKFLGLGCTFVCFFL